MLQASSALRAERNSAAMLRLRALIPLTPLPPAPDFQMLRRQQVINLDILHFFISSYLTFNEISPLTKVLLKLTLKQGQTGAGACWGWAGEEGCKGLGRKRDLRKQAAWL